MALAAVAAAAAAASSGARRGHCCCWRPSTTAALLLRLPPPWCRALSGKGGDGGDDRKSSGSGSGSAKARRRASTTATIAAAAAAAKAAADEAARLADLTAPALWPCFSAARAVRRRIIAHVGPTNSGKTHAALRALRSARSGAYCGPLRLLAAEVSERLTAAGVPCNLLTGQEQVTRTTASGAPARHVAATVEMADLSTPVAVAVVDEVQLLADASRGPAFARALLGLPARELHVCGDPAALPLLRALARDCGDELEVGFKGVGERRVLGR